MKKPIVLTTNSLSVSNSICEEFLKTGWSISKAFEKRRFWLFGEVIYTTHFVK